MHKSYQVFSKSSYGGWEYQGSFSARSHTDARSYYLTEGELENYARAFSIEAGQTMLVVCGRMAQEIKI